MHSAESQTIRGISAEEFEDWTTRREESALKIQAAWRKWKSGVPDICGDAGKYGQYAQVYDVDLDGSQSSMEESTDGQLTEDVRRHFTDLVRYLTIDFLLRQWEMKQPGAPNSMVQTVSTN